MLKPNKIVYRACPSCSAPILINSNECRICGHSLLQNPVDVEAEQILRGNVFYNGQWVSIREKMIAEKTISDKLELGKVEHDGKWVPIEEKMKMDKIHSQNNTGKIVDFPLNPDSTYIEEVAPVVEIPIENKEKISSDWKKLKNRKKIFIIVLTFISLCTMAVSIFGMFFSKYFKF